MYLWELFLKIQNNKYISLQFLTEMNTRGGKTSTCNCFRTQLWLQLHMFHFPDVTSLLCSSSGTELDLRCEIHGYEFHEKHNSWWKCWKIENQAKMACLRLHFLHHIHFCSYYSVGLGVVQMVRYFKTSWSIRVIAPLNRHFKSELRWHTQNQCHIKLTIRTFICSGDTITLLAPLSRHFTSNMSQNIYGATYFTSCEKVPTGTFSSWDYIYTITWLVVLTITFIWFNYFIVFPLFNTHSKHDLLL